MEHVTIGLSAIITKDNKLIKKFLYGLIPFILLLVGWWAISLRLESYLLPSPDTVIDAFSKAICTGELLRHTVSSMVKIAGGYLLALLFAIPLGIMIGLWQRAHDMLNPLVQMARFVPSIALIPIIVLWFGIGYQAATVIIFWGAFSPVLISTISGVEGVEIEYVDFALTHGAQRRHLLTKVIIPAALPDIFVGMRLGLSYAWRAMIAAEMLASKFGLGYLIMDARWLMQTERVIMGIITIGFIGLLLDFSFRSAEESMLKWRKGMVLK
ncbi:MAG: ABC transporter permease [Nanoarchaeota archaeon]|nr:ABC transporter permease [Nanoarchaeota archaeon]